MDNVWMKVEQDDKPVMYVVFKVAGSEWIVVDLVIEQEDDKDISIKKLIKERVTEGIGFKVSYSREERELMDDRFQEEVLKYVPYEVIFKAAFEAWKQMKPNFPSPKEVQDDE